MYKQAYSFFRPLQQQLIQSQFQQSAALNYTESAAFLSQAWNLASTSNLSEMAVAEIMYRRAITALALGQMKEARILLEEYKSKVIDLKNVMGEAKAFSSLARVCEL